MVTASVIEPEWLNLGYEEPLSCSLPPLRWPLPR
jgi:hypothetical protein